MRALPALLVAVVAVAGLAFVLPAHAPPAASPHPSGLRPAVYSGPTVTGNGNGNSCVGANGAETKTLDVFKGDTLYAVTLENTTGVTVGDSGANSWTNLHTVTLSNVGSFEMADWVATAKANVSGDVFTSTPAQDFVATWVFDITGTSGVYAAAFNSTPNNGGTSVNTTTEQPAAAVPADSLVLQSVGFNTQFDLGMSPAFIGEGLNAYNGDPTGDCAGVDNELQLSGWTYQIATAGRPNLPGFWNPATADWGVFMEAFLPTGCVSPTETNNSGFDAPVTVHLAVATGDSVVAAEVAAAASPYSHPFVSVPVDGANTYHNRSFGVSAPLHNLETAVGVWNATATTTGNLTITFAASNFYFTYVVVYDVPPMAGAGLVVGTPAFEDASGRLNLSVSAAACSALRAPVIDTSGSPSFTHGQLTAPAGWGLSDVVVAGGAYAGGTHGRVNVTGAEPTLHLTGGHAIGGGVLLAFGVPAPPPAAPTGVRASTEPLSPPFDYGQTLIDVTWTNPAGTLSDNHVYVYAPDCSTPVTSYDLGGVHTATTVGSLTHGTSYCFKASASTAGGGEGPLSAPTARSVNATLPNAPSALRVTAVSTALFSLTWTNPSGNLTGSYNVSAYAADCSGRPLHTDEGMLANPFQWGVGTAGQSFCFVVAANTSGGQGPNSTFRSAAVNATLPNAPSGLAATAISTTEIDVAWTNAGGNVTGVTLYEFAGAACGGPPISTSGAGVVTAAPFTGLTPSTNYSYRVADLTSGGQGANSSCVHNATASPPPPPPPLPPNATFGVFLAVGFGLVFLAAVLALLGAVGHRKRTRQGGPR